MDTKGTAREGESIAHVRSNMTLRLSGHISIFGLVFFVLKFLQDNGIVKNLQFCPRSLGVMLEL